MSRDSDIADVGHILDQERKERRAANLKAANTQPPAPPAGRAWTRHTEWHWSTTLGHHRLDYWPSTKRWNWNGRKGSGDVEAFIAKHGETADAN